MTLLLQLNLGFAWGAIAGPTFKAAIAQGQTAYIAPSVNAEVPK